MIIIAGHSRVGRPEDRDAGVAGFAELVRRARAADGCLDFSVSADPVEADRMNLFEMWRDRPALDAWRKIAGRIGRRPKVAISETSVKLYHTDKAERPF